MASPATQPLVVGIGGTIGFVSSTERALRIALDAAEREGFRTRLFGGEDMARLPLYDPTRGQRAPRTSAPSSMRCATHRR